MIRRAFAQNMAIIGMLATLQQIRRQGHGCTCSSWTGPCWCGESCEMEAYDAMAALGEKQWGDDKNAQLRDDIEWLKAENERLNKSIQRSINRNSYGARATLDKRNSDLVKEVGILRKRAEAWREAAIYADWEAGSFFDERKCTRLLDVARKLDGEGGES